MKNNIVKGIGLAAMCVLMMKTTASAQSSFHQLTANDFWGTPRANASGVVAYTNCTIDYRYQAQRERGGYRLNFTIRLILNNNKSWLDKSRVSTPQQMTEILKHEQGHYTIAFLEQQELLRTVSRMRFSSNYNYEAMAVFNRIDAKYKQLNSDYDEDTAHMQDRVQQHSWDVYFQKKNFNFTGGYGGVKNSITACSSVLRLNDSKLERPRSSKVVSVDAYISYGSSVDA